MSKRSAILQPALDNLLVRTQGTDDPFEFEEQMNPFAPGVSLTKMKREKFNGEADATRSPQVSLFNARLRNAHVQWDPGSDCTSVCMVLDGRAQFVEDGEALVIGVDAAHVLRPGFSFDLRCPDARSFLVLNMTEAHLRRVSQGLANGQEAKFGNLGNVLDLRHPEGASFARLAWFFWSELVRTPALTSAPHVLEHIENTLVGAFLLAADKQTGNIVGRPEGGIASNAMNAAIDFLYANLDRPLTLAEIATTAGASARTLERAFQRQYGLGAVGYHRTLRLRRVNCELIAANARETSVTDMAMKYGFYQLSHFAAAYRGLFRERPSETLRR